jgi:hypothetical protein
MVLVIALATFSLLSLGASANSPQALTSISYTFTTTSNYQMTTGGVVHVSFDSVQVSQAPPQAYQFGIVANTFPGFWITGLHWQFGDGSFRDVPYCCQTWVSETQYHAYAQEGPYTVLVVAFDNAGNFGSAVMTVNWVTPVPEYPNYGLPLIASLLVLLVGLASLRKGIRRNLLSSFSQGS